MDLSSLSSRFSSTCKRFLLIFFPALFIIPNVAIKIEKLFTIWSDWHGAFYRHLRWTFHLQKSCIMTHKHARTRTNTHYYCFPITLAIITIIIIITSSRRSSSGSNITILFFVGSGVNNIVNIVTKKLQHWSDSSHIEATITIVLVLLYRVVVILMATDVLTTTIITS